MIYLLACVSALYSISSIYSVCHIECNKCELCSWSLLLSEFLCYRMAKERTRATIVSSLCCGWQADGLCAFSRVQLILSFFHPFIHLVRRLCAWYARFLLFFTSPKILFIYSSWVGNGYFLDLSCLVENFFHLYTERMKEIKEHVRLTPSINETKIQL